MFNPKAKAYRMQDPKLISSYLFTNLTHMGLLATLLIFTKLIGKYLVRFFYSSL